MEARLVFHSSPGSFVPTGFRFCNSPFQIPRLDNPELTNCQSKTYLTIVWVGLGFFFGCLMVGSGGFLAALNIKYMYKTD